MIPPFSRILSDALRNKNTRKYLVTWLLANIILEINRHSAKTQNQKENNTMKNKMSNIAFKLMTTVGMPIRNLFMPPSKMLAEVEIKPDHQILDFGCGPGIFTILAAEKTGPSGVVYALDIHPLALKTVEQKARKKELAYIKTILSDCHTSIPDNSLDVVIFFDMFHILDNQEEVLIELHRVLKADAVMYFSDHHLKEEQVLLRLNKSGLFKLQKRGKMTLSFGKI